MNAKALKLAALSFLLFSLPVHGEEPDKAAQANAALQAQIARTHEVLARMQRLKPEDIEALSRDEATDLIIEYGEATIPLAYLAIAAGRGSDAAELRKFFREEKLDALGSPEVKRTFDLISARADPARVERFSEDLQQRYPAYDAYVKRNRVKGVLGALREPVHKLEQRAAAKQELGTLGAEDLKDVSHAKGVRSAGYENGLFHVVLDAAIAEGATLDLAVTALADGRLRWRCSAAQSIHKYVPAQCRQ